MPVESKAPRKKVNWEKFSLFALLAFGVVFLFLLLFSAFGGNRLITRHVTTSDLINTKDIADLSVCEFVYNGIARTYKENGDPDYNILYNSTVKASIDADHISYNVDEKQKIVRFIFPEIEIGNPVIDVDSISTIPDKNDLYMDDVIKLCRSDALTEAKKSNKMISSAQENLKSIMEAWYSPVFDGYTFEYQFGSSEGGDGK